VHPSGRFVYESNRGHNSIAVFRVDPQNGTLTLAQSLLLEGETPRSFALDPSGAFLIAMMQRSGTIIPLRIDAQNGELATAGDPLQLSRPVCGVFLPI
jgi:6-phosphogluconolactonase